MRLSLGRGAFLPGPHVWVGIGVWKEGAGPDRPAGSEGRGGNSSFNFSRAGGPDLSLCPGDLGTHTPKRSLKEPERRELLPEGRQT